MEVRMDLKYFFLMAAKKQNGRQITKLSITRSFFELQSPDFAWKFIWTVWTTFDKQNGHQITKNFYEKYMRRIA